MLDYVESAENVCYSTIEFL